MDKEEYLEIIGKHLSEYQRLEAESQRLCTIWINAGVAAGFTLKDISKMVEMPEGKAFFEANTAASEYYDGYVR